MPFNYTNRKGKIYFLHEGKTKTGKQKYHFSTSTEGNLVDKIPDGFEIYENPTNAQVFLRKQQPKLINDSARKLVEKYLKKQEGNKRYLVDIKGKEIIIFQSDQEANALTDIFKTFPLATSSKMEEILKFSLNSRITTPKPAVRSN